MPLVATLAGVLLAKTVPVVARLQQSDTAVVCEHAARLSLTVALMGVALRLGRDTVRQLAFAGLRLLLFAMIAMWLSAALLIRLTYADTMLFALLLAAILTPTDPIVASSIISGSNAERRVPERLRHLISMESGANDGIAYAFVYLPLALTDSAASTPFQSWLTHTLLLELAGGGLVGLGVGIGAGLLLSNAISRGWTETPPVVVYAIALALLIYAVAGLLHISAPFAVFLGGLGFRHWMEHEVRTTQRQVAEGFNDLVTMPVFLLLGAVIPWREWSSLGWLAMTGALLVVILRRLPAVWLGRRLLPQVDSTPDVLFVGWFGPIGVSSLFYAALAVTHAGQSRVWPFCTLVVAISVVVHGVTAAPLLRLYGRATKSSPATVSG